MSMYTASKYKNLKAGEAINPSFDDINFKKTDCTLVAGSQTLIAFVIETSGGCFIYLPNNKTGRVTHGIPKVCAHKSEITDMAFYPFSTNILATCSADMTIKIWELPEDGLKKDMEDFLVELTGHQRKVTVLVWHPTTENILISGGGDPFCYVWNVSTGEMCYQVDVGDAIQGMSFNYDGSMVALMTRTKKLSAFDPRNGKIESSIVAHDGNRAFTPVFLKNRNIFTCGTSKNGDREFALWDSNDLSQPLKKIKYDNNRGQMIPHYEPEHDIVFIFGKGETLSCALEFYENEPYFTVITNFNLTNGGGLRGFNVFPKIACKVLECEIMRGMRVHSNSCEIVSFTVPRLSKEFQSDLFDKIRGTTPSQTDKEYLAGSNTPPIMIDLRTVKTGGLAKSKTLNINLAAKKSTQVMDLEERLSNIEKRLSALEKH